jgi:YD repeat-containing protein
LQRLPLRSSRCKAAPNHQPNPNHKTNQISHSKWIKVRGHATDGAQNTVNSIYDVANRVLQNYGNAAPVHETFYTYNDAASTVTSSNALGEATVTHTDALGRPTSIQTVDTSGNICRQTSYQYSSDHQSMLRIDGTASQPIATTVYTDTFNQPVLTIHGDASYALTSYDANGNILAKRDEQGNIATMSYDALNRVISETTPSDTGANGAETDFVYINNGQRIERHMPGGTVAVTTLDNAGRKVREELDGNGGNGSSVTRKFGYYYYGAASTGAGTYPGKLYQVTDPRGFTTTSSYDGFGRLSSVASAGSAVPQQNQTTSYGYDGRNLVTEIDQNYADPTTGPGTKISRLYDAYREKCTEAVAIGTSGSTQWTQQWDAAGRRYSLTSNLNPQGPGQGAFDFGYRADGIMTSATEAGQGLSFNYGDNGLLSSRSNPWRTLTIDGRDLVGRITKESNWVWRAPEL